MILLDDVGFAQLGCYGASIRTPRMDALAAGGVRYTNFHVAALCSPTRASLLTGRNHHAVGMGFLAAFDTGYPGYRAAISPRAATLAEMLRDDGYGTYAAGKWHLTPPSQMSPAGPFDQWPTQRGFDRYYGFLWGEDDQFAPELWYDQHRVEVPGDPDYHLSRDLVRRSEQFLSDHMSARPDDPFFLYLAFGAGHAPHQAPRSYIDRYRGAFDHGWDEERDRVLARQIELGIVPAGTALAPRNPDVRAWDDLNTEQRRLYTRMEEVFAGFMEHTDEQIGALVDFLARYNALEDTLLILLSDNGASGEGGENGMANEYRYFLGLGESLEQGLTAYDDLGGPETHNHYPAGWAQAGNTPLKFYKKYAHGGGVRVPLVMHWPRGLNTPERLRTQFHHVIDILPTVMEVTNSEPPAVYRGVEQMPVHGTSMAYTFEAPLAPSRRTLQYFEAAGYRGIVKDGWKAVASHEPGEPFEADHWELYRIEDDFSECHDRSRAQPDVAGELRLAWWQEAERYGVLPLDDRMRTRFQAQNPALERLRYELLPGSRLLNGVTGPNFAGRRFRVIATVERTADGNGDGDGVLLAYGRRASGFSFFIKEDRLVLDYNLADTHTLVASENPLPLGPAVLEMRTEHRGQEVWARLLVDGRTVAAARLPQLLPGGMGTLSIQCGHNSPSTVSREYRAPFAFRGRLDCVVVELEPRAGDTSQTDWDAEMAQQ